MRLAHRHFTRVALNDIGFTPAQLHAALGVFPHRARGAGSYDAFR